MASRWLKYDNSVHFPASRFIDAVRFRCATALPGRYCSCGVNLATSRTHPVFCRQNSQFTAVHRHNETLSAVASVCRQYGFTVMVEPQFYADQDNRRPDLTFCLGPRSVAIDLTVVDPTAHDNIKSASLTQGITASTAADLKIKKHLPQVAAFGHHFNPWAIETFGHIDEHLVSSLRSIAHELPCFLRSHFIKQVIYTLSSYVQSGNAGILNAWRHRHRS